MSFNASMVQLIKLCRFICEQLTLSVSLSRTGPRENEDQEVRKLPFRSAEAYLVDWY